MFFLSRRRVSVILSGLCVALFYAALLVTQSRGGFYACIASTLIFLPLVLLKNPDGLPWKKLAFIVAAAVLVPVLLNGYHHGALDENLVGKTAMQNTRSLEDRFYLWESTARMIKEHFWFGTGLASFYFYYPRYRLPLDRSDGFFAHMDPLQFWAEMGVMAPILFYGTLVFVLFRTIRAVRIAGPDMRKRIEVIAPFCGMLALIGHTHLTFHLYMPGILLPLSGLMAYWYLATERAIGDAAARRLWKPEGAVKKAVITVIALVMLVTTVWVARCTAATYMLTIVQRDANQNKMAEAHRMLSLAGIVAPSSYGRYYEYEARLRLARLISGAAQMDKDDARKLYEETMSWLDKAEKVNPAFTTIWDLRARLYYAVDGIVLDDGYERATDLLQKVIDNNPLAADSRVGLANVYRSRGEIKKAVHVLESGIEWPRPKGRPDLNFLITLATLKRQMGDEEAYNMYMQEARRRAASYGMVLQ